MLFYQGLLGLEVRWRAANSVELTTPGRSDIITLQEGGRGRGGEMGGIGHFGFRLPAAADINMIAEAVEAAGGTVMDKGHFTREQPYVFAKDPDGYIIELWYEP